MTKLFTKNVNLAANTADLATAAQTFTLTGVKVCEPGARCQLCHQPIGRAAEIKFKTGESRYVGLDCLERLEWIRRAGREPVKGELATERRAKRAWRSDRGRKPVIASAVAFLRQRREALPEDERRALDFLEVAGYPRTVEEGEALLAYYRQADPLWLLRLVRQKHPDWRKKLGTVFTLRVIGAENFRQVRERNTRHKFLSHYSGRQYVHEWTYSDEKGTITLKCYSREWYEDKGNYRSRLSKPFSLKPKPTLKKVITAVFEAGKPNPVATNPSDMGPYVIPDFRIQQEVQIEVGRPYQVEITRYSVSGKTRFCRVLAPID